MFRRSLKVAVSGISTWHATYNKRNMLTGESLQLTGQDAWSISYAHDTYGSVSLIHYPDDENVSYAPDPLGRATQVGTYMSGITYFPNGDIDQATLGNGTTYVGDQNSRGLLRNLTYGRGGTPQLSEDLTYDKNGNITQFDDLAGGPRSKTLTYDALNRLVGATGQWGTETYAYDPLNNLRARVKGTQTTNYNYNSSNLLMSLSGAGATSFTYDTRGNVTGKGDVALQFDQKNQLLSLPGISYAYDASGRRVKKTPATGEPTYSFYNQAGQLMYQFEPGLARATSFAYLGRKLVGSNETLKLGAPGAVHFDANPNNGSYTVSWGAVMGATSYVLQEKSGGGNWATVYSAAAASAPLSGRAGGDYVYQVRGCNGATCGPWTFSATVNVTPAVPVVSVPGGTINGSYTVSWTAPPTANAYDVQESLNGGAWTVIATHTSATSISRPGTTSGSYTYQVAAFNTYGSRGWASSGAVTVDTTYGVLPAPPASLAVPAASNNGNATLSWEATLLTTSYKLQQSANGGASWANLYEGGGTSAGVSALADGSYSYRVQSCNTYGCSGWRAGNTSLVVTHPPTAAPTLSVPASSGNGSYTVSWSGVPGPVSYTLQESINAGGWSTVQANGYTSWSTSGRGNGGYRYQVQACNVGGCGPWSVIAGTTVLLPPLTPGSITIPVSSNGPVTLSWAASTTATSYTLQHANSGITGWSTIYTGGATSRSQTETTTGSWIYQVRACNASGCSAFRVSSGGVTVTIPPASAPSVSVPASSNTGSYTVSWSGVGSATSYTLQEQANGGGWATIQNSSATSKAISGKGTASYGYRAQACNAGGCGPWSGTGSITVHLSPDTPATPSVSTTGPSYRPVVHVSWPAVAGATNYQLEKTDPDAGVTVSNVGTTTSFSALMLVNGEVAYRVSACSSQGCSPYSGYGSVYLNSGGLGILSAPAPATSTQPTEAAQ